MSTSTSSQLPNTNEMAISKELSHDGAALTALNSEGTVTPLEFDVLCSKDKTHSTHAGNRLFRERIDAMKEVYRMTKNKQGKMEITKNIVKYLKQRHATRFLKRDVNGSWTEISDQAARDKVSHALRFATRRENATTKRMPPPHLQGSPPLAPPRPPADYDIRHGGMGPPAPVPGPAADGTAPAGTPGSVYYGRTVPVEHIEPSKWLLALRQGP